MADIDEIRAYLETHPDDHKQRWRLAKKLYNAWDYRSALAELLALQEAWPDQVPVQRYLAATYYRLGKYAESEAILVKAIGESPDDVTLLEQLAKVHEGAGRTEKAIDAWSRVLEKKPSSKSAEEALERLGMAVGTMASTMAGATMAGEMSDHGNDTIIICPHCGEGNDVFSKRCTRCHGAFGNADAAMAPEETPVRVRARAGLVFFLSFLAVAALCGAIFYWLAISR